MSRGGYCSFHYHGQKEELNGRIDKRLKRNKKGRRKDKKRKKENWRVMGEREGNIFYRFFTSPGLRRRKESDREHINKQRGKKRRDEHH